MQAYTSLPVDTPVHAYLTFWLSLLVFSKQKIV